MLMIICRFAIFMQERSRGEKHGVSFMHEQNFICSQIQLDEITQEQIIICRPFFAGHVVGSQSMKRKKTLHRMIIIDNEHLLLFLSSASSHLLSDTLDVTSTVLALRTLGTFDFEGESKVKYEPLLSL